MSDKGLPPRKKPLGVLPPPPRMTASQSTQQPQTHSISTNIPILESAPTSGNFEDFAAAASDQLQAAMSILGSQATQGPPPSPRMNFPPVLTPQASPNKSMSRPLPPPPPPPPVSTRTLPPPPPPSGGLNPTIAPLPPPPMPNVAKHPVRPSPPVFVPTTTILPPSPSSQATPDARTLSSPPPTEDPPPPFLTPMQFRAKQQLHVTASRQEHLTVLVVASESAHRMAWKNGLRLSDLLSGLYRSATTSGANPTPPLAPFRSIARPIAISWQDVRISFVEEEHLTAVSDDQSAERLQNVAALQATDGNLPQELELLEDQIDNLLGTPAGSKDDGPTAAAARAERHAHVVQDAFQLTSPLNIPWLLRYRMAADDCTDHLAHEQFPCPAVILAVCTTAETNPVIETLRSLHLHLPIPFRNGQYDAAVARKEVLVLHDPLHGHPGFDEATLRNHLVSAFGPASNVMRINSLAEATAAVLAEEEESDLWGGGGKLGSCMTVSDRARVRKYLTQLVATAVLPSMERRIADLNAIVSDRKKGVKNVLKSFWGGRKKEDEESTPTTVTQGSVQYRHDSVETQVRLLADSLFLMRDYDTAYSMYRLIKDDFKQDKSWMHYASVHEMMSLSLYMHDPFGRSKEVFSSVETALLSYNRAFEEAPQWGEKPGRTKVAPASTRLATRLCLVLISTRNICSGRHLEVADLLASASSNETSLGAAVLLEQSAANYFKAELYRKYAFHMLMSGHMFRAGEQEHHAFRCFASALHIYRDGHWKDLHNHLRSALAAQLFSMNRMAISLQLYSRLVGCLNGGRVSVMSQQKFVHNLLEICKEHTKKALVGADRMAAPAHLVGEERDAFRQERLDRIVQVIRYTRSASRVLELPNMQLPQIRDSSVRVFTSEEASHHGYQDVQGFGETQTGSNQVWDDLMISMMSELKAESNTPGEEIIIGKTLTKIEDPAIRKIIALVEKEKTKRNLAEKAKRLGKRVESAPVRALEEPITVEFELRNTLEIEVEVKDIQLVARMTADDTALVCTNEDAINIRPLETSPEKGEWTFQNSKVVYELADFCRLSSGDAEKKSWRSAEDNDPFFVVTKESMKLQPDSVQSIAASICPLIPGQLEVVGVRSKLLGEVWVYHPFDIKGPLLQNTRSNRVNRVRGESFLLRSSVKQAMPSLTVDLVPCGEAPAATSDEIGPVIESQHRRWTLRISNVGTAPASNLSLKTNVPWIMITKPAPDVWDQSRQQVSTIIGPTGTLMAVPLEGSSLKEQHKIYPGESLLVDVEIRPSASGTQDFYMLFRYELADEVSIQHRWLKKMFSVPVYPSLNVSASLAPAFAGCDDFVLSLEVDNLRRDRPDNLELSLDDLSMVSKDYILTALPGFDMDNEVGTVGWQEKSSYHFHVKPVPVGASSVLSTRCAFSPTGSLKEGEEAIKGTSAAASFLCIEHAHETFREAVTMHHRALARATSQGEDGGHPRSIASIRRSNVGDSLSANASDSAQETVFHHWPFVDSEKVQLVCSWKDGSNSMNGFHTIRNIQVCPNLDTTECPIVVTAEHPPTVENDFSLGPARVPLQVTLRNKQRKDPVNFEFSIQQPETFGLTGPEKCSAKLAGGEKLSIPYQAVLPSAGVYNLQCVRVSVASSGDAMFTLDRQWIVTANSMLHEL